MAGLSIYLLGPFDISGEDGHVEAPNSAKAQELLCYLLLHRDRPVPRSKLAELLWADHDAVHALKLLRQALWQLQLGCGHAKSESARLLFDITPRSITLRSGPHLWLDVAEFEGIFERMRRPMDHHHEAADPREGDRAVTLYRGDLLEGYDFDWCVVEREWLRSAYLTILDRLMGYCERHGEYELGLDYGERILRVDGAREYTHRRMMVLHALLGNRTDALRQYNRCVAALTEELDVDPARSTVLLRDQIRDGADIFPANLTRTITPSLATPESTANAIERLRRIQRALGVMHMQVQAEFHGLEADA